MSAPLQFNNVTALGKVDGRRKLNSKKTAAYDDVTHGAMPGKILSKINGLKKRTELTLVILMPRP